MQKENRAGHDSEPVVSQKEARYLINDGKQQEQGELSKIALDHNHQDAIKHFRGEMNKALEAGNAALAEHFKMRIEIQKKMNGPRRERMIDVFNKATLASLSHKQTPSAIPSASALRQAAQQKVQAAMEAAKRKRESAS